MTTSEPDDVLSLARALLDTVRERDVLRDLCAVINGDGGHMQVAEGTVAAVEAAQGRWHALQARADVAERERDEARDRAWHIGADLADWRHRAFAAERRAEASDEATAITTERARVVEAIAAWHVAESNRIEAEAPTCSDKRPNRERCHICTSEASDHRRHADHIRSHNWAAPEEES